MGKKLQISHSTEKNQAEGNKAHAEPLEIFVFLFTEITVPVSIYQQHGYHKRGIHGYAEGIEIVPGKDHDDDREADEDYEHKIAWSFRLHVFFGFFFGMQLVLQMFILC